MRSVQQVDASEVRVVACPYCGRTPRRASGGFKVVRDKKLIGLIGYAPARDELGHAPSGSAVITVLWVNPNDVGEHVGTQLVQRVAWQLRASGVKCLIASGTRGVPTCERLPADWLESVGFNEHVSGVQWRMDLRNTLPVWSWLRDLAYAAQGQLRGWRPRPENATRSTGLWSSDQGGC